MKRLTVIFPLFLLLSGCKKETPPVAQAREKLPTVAVSHWTEKTELFAEHPVLVAGCKARFAIHLTSLRDFKALAKGRVTVELVPKNAVTETFFTDASSRPGIFGVDVQPKASGTYTLSVQLNSPELDDVHELGPVTVYANAAQAAASHPEEEKTETITFLKEQQWAMDFATEEARDRAFRESLKVPGEVRPRTGGEVEVTAPTAGRLSTSHAVPAVGTAVTKGQILASLIPRAGISPDRPSLEFAVSEATTALELARKNRERVERLLAVGAIPSKRLEEAQASEVTEAARVKAAQTRLAQYETSRQAEGEPPRETAFLVRSPISGVVAESHATAGASVEEGESLYRIVALDAVYVVASIPESEAVHLRQVTGGEIELPGLERPLALGRLVSIGRIVDPASRTLSVITEAANSRRLLSIGQAVSLRLFVSGQSKGVAVPERAIIDDAGRPVVFVQLGGESFQRRPVRLGSRETGYVEVLEGIRTGERVVTRGAYLIRLAALSTQIPGHGHVH